RLDTRGLIDLAANEREQCGGGKGEHMSKGVNTRLLSTQLAIALVTVLCTSPAAALQTIDDIVKKCTIVVGVSTTTPIFGLIGQNGEPEGYDPDVARLL